MVDANGSEDAVIRARGVGVRFGGRVALADVDLDLRRGEVLSVLGPSGCGKSTLLKCLAGLLAPNGGRVEVLGRDIVGLSEQELAPYRRRMGVAFQGGALFNSMTLLENIVLPIVENTSVSLAEARDVARLKLDLVGLSDAAGKLPSELSGGMKKRGAIARALALDPEVLFLDEPTSGLDPITSAEMDELILAMNHSLAISVLAVTHEIASALHISDRAALMEHGRLLVVQPPDELRENTDPRVWSFVRREAPPRQQGDLADLLEGEPA